MTSHSSHPLDLPLFQLSSVKFIRRERAFTDRRLTVCRGRASRSGNPARRAERSTSSQSTRSGTAARSRARGCGRCRRRASQVRSTKRVVDVDAADGQVGVLSDVEAERPVGHGLRRSFDEDS